jgi:hypothetical protein
MKKQVTVAGSWLFSSTARGNPPMYGYGAVLARG